MPAGQPFCHRWASTARRWFPGGKGPCVRGGVAFGRRRADETFYLRSLGVASVLVPVMVTAILAAGLFSWPMHELPEESRAHPSITRIYAGDGSEIAAIHAFETYIPVTYDQIPETLKDAVIAVEDQRFFAHRGVDVRAVLRAVWRNLRYDRAVEGGSTITQQYVKQAFMGDQDRTVMTKIREAVLAARVERSLSKDEILHRYLSAVYFGGGAYGVGAAADGYFRKKVGDLTLSEAALLAAVIRAPTALNPRSNPAGAEQRRQLVLRLMHEQGRIGPLEYEAARRQRVTVAGAGAEDDASLTTVYAPRAGHSRYPYFVDYVRRYLVARYGEDRVVHGGLRVETALDPHLQQLAEQAVSEGLSGTGPPVEMALVSVEPGTGLVRALVGGRDFSRSQVNLALGGCPPAGEIASDPQCLAGGGTGRQPGSAFKIFPLAQALQEGMPLTRTYSAPARYRFPNCRGNGCTVHNAGGGGYGRLTLRRALAYSVNTVFAQLIEDVGVKDTAQLARRMGITTLSADGKHADGDPYGPGLALGTAEVSPLDMAAAYGVIANRGVRVPASPVVKVTAPSGEVLEDNSARRGRRVLRTQVADELTQALEDVVAYGTGKSAIDLAGVAGKTGTSENYSDAWFVGFTPTISTAVWMGYSDARRPLTHVAGRARVYGGTIPAETWAAFMKPALEAHAST